MTITPAHIIMILTGMVAALCLYSAAIRNENRALQRERDTLREEIAAHERERAKMAAELQRMTEKAAALQKAGKKGEDRINDQIKKSGDPCLGRRPDDAMLNLLREQLPHHPE
jgi:predicted Holliday junction resolvase-like endonuclease